MIGQKAYNNELLMMFQRVLTLHLGIQLFQLRLSRRQGKRSNMSAKGLSGKTNFIPEYIIPFIDFPLSLKLDLAFLWI